MSDIVTKTVRCEGGLPAFLAVPAASGRLPAVVLMHERYGLVPHTCDLAQRFARDGFVCIAPDFFHRHPDQDALHRGDVGYDMSDPEAVEYLDAAIAWLAALPQVDQSKIVVAGVCQTGRHPLVLAAERPIAAALIWYGAASTREWQVSARYPKPLDELIARVNCPVLGIFGEADHVISLEDVRRLRDTLDRHDKTYRIKVYPGRAARLAQRHHAGALPPRASGSRLGVAARVPRDGARSGLRPLAAGAGLRMRALGGLRFHQERADGVMPMARDFEDHCWKDVVDPDTIQIYQAYRRKIYVGDNPAVLAIDLYNKAYRGGDRPVKEVDREFSGSCGEYAWKAMAPTQKLLAAARRAGLPIFYTTRHVDTAGVHSTNRNIGAEADDTYDIKAELAPASGDIVIYKERASGFFGTPLIAHLQQKRINSLIICGESTSGCVRASTVDAYSYGFHNVVVEECTYDRSLISHKVNLFDLHHKYADVMHVEEVLAHLDGLAQGRKVA